MSIIGEVIKMAIITFLTGLLTGFIFSACGGKFNTGEHIGTYVGVGLYVIYCIYRIIRPTEEATLVNGKWNTTKDSSSEGVIGLIIVAVALIFTAVTGRW